MRVGYVIQGISKSNEEEQLVNCFGQKDAYEILEGLPVGTFILRKSESDPGSIIYATVQSEFDDNKQPTGEVIKKEYKIPDGVQDKAKIEQFLFTNHLLDQSALPLFKGMDGKIILGVTSLSELASMPEYTQDVLKVGAYYLLEIAGLSDMEFKTPMDLLSHIFKKVGEPILYAEEVKTNSSHNSYISLFPPANNNNPGWKRFCKIFYKQIAELRLQEICNYKAKYTISALKAEEEMRAAAMGFRN